MDEIVSVFVRKSSFEFAQHEIKETNLESRIVRSDADELFQDTSSLLAVDNFRKTA